MAAKSNIKKENDSNETKSIGMHDNGGKRVQVMIPRIPGANEDEFFSANGVDYIVKRGYPVEVPEILAEGIRNGQLAEQAAFDFSKKLQDDAKEDKLG